MVLITPREAAELLGVKVSQIYRWVQRDEIPTAVNNGPLVRFDRDVLTTWAPPVRPLTRDGKPRRVRLSKGVDWELAPEQIEALPTDGWVYFVQSTRGGPIKIGLARDVARRVAALQAACPFQLVVLAQMPGGRRLEYQLHRRFAAGRRHGEWFNEATPGLRAFIREAAA